MRKLLVASQKGGVGKTTTSINVAAATALAGARVLLLDADPLSSISSSLNLGQHAQRQTLRLARLRSERHEAWPGFNRAQAAVVEGAVLVSRLHLLPRAKIESEMAYLQIAIDKTAGPCEHEAWGWLQGAVAREPATLEGRA